MKKIFIFVTSIFFLSACSTSSLQPTRTPTPTKPSITNTPTPSSTHTPSPTTDPIQEYLHRLPPKPDGFEWRFVPEVSMAVLIPDGWFYKYEFRDDLGIDTFYVTEENIDAVGRFSTGLSVFVFTDVTDPEKYSTDLLAINVAAETTKKVIGAWDYDAGLSVLHHLEIEGEFPYETEVNQNKIIHYVSLSYGETVYFSFFESPAAIWEETKEDFGVILLDTLAILDVKN